MAAFTGRIDCADHGLCHGVPPFSIAARMAATIYEAGSCLGALSAFFRCSDGVHGISCGIDAFAPPTADQGFTESFWGSALRIFLGRRPVVMAGWLQALKSARRGSASDAGVWR